MWPGIIDSYEQKERRVRIRMDGLTDKNNGLLPEADLIYPLGDRHNNTEIDIQKGDLVWVSFLGNDIRYPIVMGYRQPKQGVSVDWRRFKHKNIEFNAEEELKINCKTLTFTCETFDIDASQSVTTNTATLEENVDSKTTIASGNVEITAVQFNVDALTNILKAFVAQAAATVSGAFAYLGGMTGGGGSGAGARISGGIENTGGEIISNGVSLDALGKHVHTDSKKGKTTEPEY